jgi:hypothetical protein
MAALCSLLHAQTGRTITIRMLDGRTGKLIATSDFLVRVNYEQTVHGNWVRMNADGTGEMKLPKDASQISIRATYDSNTIFYVNCDADKDRGAPDRAAGTDRWYPVADILASGVVAPNGCVGKKAAEKFQISTKPGEFVFFVRRLNLLEQMHE